MRFNIRRMKALVWVLCLLALAMAGWTFFEIYSAKTEGEFAPRTGQYFLGLVQPPDESKAARKAKPFYPEERYKALWEARVDGSVRPKPGPDAGGSQGGEIPQAAPKLPDLGSIVSIASIVWSAAGEDRFIAVTYQQPGAPTGGAAPVTDSGKVSQLHLSEGDPLKPPYDTSPYNGRVVSIGMQEVVFRWGEEDVKITPKLQSDGEGIPISQWSPKEAEDLAAEFPAAPESTTQVRPGTWVLGTRDIDAARQDPQAFLEQQLRVRTVTPKDGQRTLLELTDVPDGSLAKQFGFAPKDKIISVNGVPMSSLSSAINWYKQNPDLPVYDIVYESLGQQKTLTIVVK